MLLTRKESGWNSKMRHKNIKFNPIISMRNIRFWISFIILSIVFFGLGSGLLVIFINTILKSVHIRFEMTNLWGADFFFYIAFILFPFSYLIEQIIKKDCKISRFASWFLFPLIYLFFYLFSLTIGLTIQIKNLPVSIFNSSIVTPTSFNFNIKKLAYFISMGLMLSLAIQIALIQKIKNRVL